MRFQTRQIALFSVLTAASIGIQLTPSRPPNIETTSLFTFFVGVIFGAVAGGLFGTLVMFVNGFLSPAGVAGLNLPFQIIGMSIIGVAGGVFKRYGVTGQISRVAMETQSFRKQSFKSKIIRVTRQVSRVAVEAAILGSFLTLTYDIITNIGYALIMNVPIIFALMMGIVFSLIHIVSNTLLFGFVFAPLLKASKVIGELKGS